MGKNGKVKERKQKFDALDDWFNKMCDEHGQAKAEYMGSKLKVMKSYRRRNDLKRDLPGGVFFIKVKDISEADSSRVANISVLLAWGKGISL